MCPTFLPKPTKLGGIAYVIMDVCLCVCLRTGYWQRWIILSKKAKEEVIKYFIWYIGQRTRPIACHKAQIKLKTIHDKKVHRAPNWDHRNHQYYGTDLFVSGLRSIFYFFTFRQIEVFGVGVAMRPPTVITIHKAVPFWVTFAAKLVFGNKPKDDNI